jgi:hypothetical protein
MNKKEKVVFMEKLKAELIAPCGMNCGLCSEYLALTRGLEKSRKLWQCKGCRPRNKMCSFIKKKCDILGKGQVEFCFECGEFPCELISKLDKGYQKKYNYSFIENLKYIKEHGMDVFLESEYKKYKCHNCGDIRCIHNGKCYSCQTITTWRG